MAAVSGLAGRQNGLVTRQQLLALGLTTRQIVGWNQRSRLHRVHQGVYAVGHASLDADGQHRAALLAAGSDSALFRNTAAFHLGLTKSAPEIPELVICRRLIQRPGITVQRSTTMDWSVDTCFVRGLRCTTVARTLVDLAADLGFTDLEQAAANAEFKRILDLRALERALNRAGAPKGAASIRRLLDHGQVAAQTRFERSVLRGLVDAGLPTPALQADFTLPDGTRVRPDFYWPAARVVGEADGPHHLNPVQQAKDRRRDAGLGALGLAVIRIPKAEWDHDPAPVIARVWRAVMD